MTYRNATARYMQSRERILGSGQLASQVAKMDEDITFLTALVGVLLEAVERIDRDAT